MQAVAESLTGQFLAGNADDRARRRSAASRPGYVEIQGATQHNLKSVDVKVPLGVFCAVTGVSGSGKSTLINEILYKAVANKLHRSRMRPGAHKRIRGLEHLDKIISVDQSPIGRTPRSNPATYIGLFDQIRDLYSKTQEARARGYKPGRFSFNVKGGRCEVCRGDGQIKIEMHFLPDIYVPCEQCHGKRYNRETLDIRFKGKTIADVLDMPVEEALGFFAHIPKLQRRLQTLHDVGLDYMRLGQPATTLSGGEAQRIKLAAELAKVATGRTLYILDEPTTGLHFADIQKLLEVLQRLVEAGNSVVVIEHNLDVIKTADRIIDMGPEGGEEGGTLMAAGTPEEIAAVDSSYTGRFLRGLDEAGEAQARGAQARGPQGRRGRVKGRARHRPRLRMNWARCGRFARPRRRVWRASVHLPAQARRVTLATLRGALPLGATSAAGARRAAGSPPPSPAQFVGGAAHAVATAPSDDDATTSRGERSTASAHDERREHQPRGDHERDLVARDERRGDRRRRRFVPRRSSPAPRARARRRPAASCSPAPRRARSPPASTPDMASVISAGNARPPPTPSSTIAGSRSTT